MNEKIKKYKKHIIAVSALVLLVLTYQILFNGGERKAASEMAQQIEDLKGPEFKKKFDKFVLERYSKLIENEGPEQKAKDVEQMKQRLQKIAVDFNYADIDKKSDGGVGYAVVKSPVLTIADADGQKAEFRLGNLQIGQAANDKNHIYYSSQGEFEIFLEQAGAKNKTLGITFADLKGEVKTAEKNDDLYTKITANNLVVIEGKGNTTLAKIGSINNEQETKYLPDGKISSWLKAEYKNIEPGDLLKMLFGTIEPITIHADYSFEGDNPVAAYSKLAAVRGENPAPATPVPAPAPFEARVKLNNFEILMGDAGIRAGSELEFRKGNTNSMPYGSVKISVVNYSALRDLLTNAAHMAPEKIANNEKLIGEIAAQENNGYVFNIVFDGSETVKINGKTIAELTQIFAKDPTTPPTIQFGKP